MREFIRTSYVQVAVQRLDEMEEDFSQDDNDGETYDV